MEDKVLIVPAYKPTLDMIPMLKRFAEETDYAIVVVDDGSGSEYQALFAEIPDKAMLLRHPMNRGKGAALKTAIQHILANMPGANIAVTADADGQHRFEDILNIAEIADEKQGTLVLGSRAFDGEVPLRSKLGNGITRQVFAAASGVKVRDTQTGLRAFDRRCMESFLNIPGERYEYEINMLLYAARNGIPIYESTIETVYLDNNSSSHFNPFRDSLKIYLCIFKYVLSSLIAFLVDTIALLLFRHLLDGKNNALLISVILARIVSATVNFSVNKRVVFKSNGSWREELPKYAVLALITIAANYCLLHLMTEQWDWALLPSKILVEVVLFCVNFFVQGRLVYRVKTKKN